jgi:chromosome segregation ATPase
MSDLVIKSLRTQIDALTARLAAVREDKRGLKVLLGEARAERDAWRGATGLATLTPEEAGDQIDREDEERERLKARIAELEEAYLNEDLLRARLEAAEIESGNARMDAGELQNVVDGLEERLEAAEAEVRQLKRINGRLVVAAEIFEKNSAACVEEYEGRLKAEARVAELEEDIKAKHDAWKAMAEPAIARVAVLEEALRAAVTAPSGAEAWEIARKALNPEGGR